MDIRRFDVCASCPHLLDLDGRQVHCRYRSAPMVDTQALIRGI